MLQKQMGNAVELERKYVEHRYCEIAREIYATIHAASLGTFTHPWIDTLLDGLNGTLYQLDRAPEAIFKELIEVIDGLSESRNELRLARFLFDVKEINSVHRLIMRNRAVLRGKKLLHRVLRVWPLNSA